MLPIALVDVPCLSGSKVSGTRAASPGVDCRFQDSSGQTPHLLSLLLALVIPEGSGSDNTLDYRVLEEVGEPVAEMPSLRPLLVHGRDRAAFRWVPMGEAGGSPCFTGRFGRSPFFVPARCTRSRVVSPSSEAQSWLVLSDGTLAGSSSLHPGGCL